MAKQGTRRENLFAIVAAALLWLSLEGSAERLARFGSRFACHAASAVPSLVLAFWQAFRAQVFLPSQLWDSVPRTLVWFWHLLALAATL